MGLAGRNRDNIAIYMGANSDSAIGLAPWPSVIYPDLITFSFLICLSEVTVPKSQNVLGFGNIISLRLEYLHDTYSLNALNGLSHNCVG